MNTVKIDGVDYALDSLSEEAKSQIAGIQAVDRRAQDLREQLVLLQAARHTYVSALKAKLEGTPALDVTRVQADADADAESVVELPEASQQIN